MPHSRRTQYFRFVVKALARASIFVIGWIIYGMIYIQKSTAADYDTLRARVASGQTEHHAANPDYTTLYTTLCSGSTICPTIKPIDKLSSKDQYTTTVALHKVVSDQQIFLSSYPLDLIGSLKSISVSGKKDARRAFANHHSLTVYPVGIQVKELFKVLTHETAHIVDLGTIQGKDSVLDGNFTEFEEAVFSIDDVSLGYYALSRDKETTKKPKARAVDFCTMYGMTNIFEDYAECTQLYLNDNTYFVHIAKESHTLTKKYQFLAGLYARKYIYTNMAELDIPKIKKNYRYWDSTRL